MTYSFIPAPTSVVPRTYGDAAGYASEDGCVVDPSIRLVFAGDWCYNGRVEGAWRSGHAAANAVLSFR